jgi:hypothetical protein
MLFQTDLEKKLFDEGLTAFGNTEKNTLIATLANRVGKVFSEINDDYLLNYHRDLKKESLNEDCENTILGGFTATNGHIYRCNRDDQTNMIGQKDELRDDPTILEVEWRTEDEGYISHTREDWLQVYREAFVFKKTQLFKCKSLKQRATDATSHDEIIAVKWDTI